MGDPVMMKAVNRWIAVLSLALCACGSSEVPLPSVVSVAPPSMATNESILLTINLDQAQPPRFDYGNSSAEMLASARVSIGEQEFEVSRVEDQGKRLVVELPPGMPVGPQQFQVKFADGRKVMFESGFEVKPPLNITELSIDPITTQVRLKKFTMRIRVAGPDAELFHGRVKLSASKGTITPNVSDAPFSQGVCIQEVILDDTGGSNVTITAEDYAGHSFTSNDFRLNPN
jgi:hypothetical protein